MLYARDGLAIVSGLNPDAPLGTKVAFLTGAAGWVTWEGYGEGVKGRAGGGGQGTGAGRRGQVREGGIRGDRGREAGSGRDDRAQGTGVAR